MFESTLNLKKTDLEQKVGRFLGYGDGITKAWTVNQTAGVRDCVESGLRRFYYPTEPYSWSFLRPTATISLLSGEQTVTLPDDFGNPEGDITITTTGGQTWWPLQLVGEGQLRNRYSQSPSTTGRPIAVALRPQKGTELLRSQRFEFFFWPIADQDYTLECVYSLLMDALTSTHPYCYGGAAHAETILESCLAVAESRLDDSMTVHALEFQRRMAASIALDRRSKPAHLGYNGDRSDNVRRWNRVNPHYLGRITYNGQEL